MSDDSNQKNGRESKLNWNVRQDRVVSSTGDMQLEFEGQKYNVTNFSAFGIGLLSDKELPDSVFDAKLKIRSIDIGTVSLAKKRQDKKDTALFETGYMVIGPPIDVASIEVIEEIEKITEQHLSEMSAYDILPKSFTSKVLEIRDWLKQLEVKINKLEKNTFELTSEQLNSYNETVCSQIAEFISKHEMPKIEALGSEIKKEDKKTTELAFDYFHTKVGSILHLAPHPNRAYYKPRGYAGDYEMMNQLYFPDNRGESLFSKCLHRLFVAQPAAQAVRNRGDYLFNKLINFCEEDYAWKVLSVASGPAREIVKLLFEQGSNLNSDIEFHLLDQDEAALKSSQLDINEAIRLGGFKGKVFFHHTGIRSIIKGSFKENDFDLIYSAGLFDYLNDPTAKFTAEQLYKLLRKKGKLVIGNFATDHPNQFGMSIMMDWNLIYRSREQMKNLFSSIPESYSLEEEELGINLFAILSRGSN